MYVCVYLRRIALSLSLSLSLYDLFLFLLLAHCSSSSSSSNSVCWVYYYYYYSMLFFFPSSSNFAPWFLGVLLLWISADRERVMDSPPLPASLTVRLRINGYQKQNASFFFHLFVRFFFISNVDSTSTDRL